MITVPSCEECNSGKGDGIDRKMSLDEEYVRTVFCMSEPADRHPIAMKVLTESVFTSFDRSPKFQQSFLKSGRFETQQTPSGILIPNKFTFEYDMSRMTRVFTKIAKGLFYNFSKRPVKKTSAVNVYAKVDQETVDYFAKMINDANHVGPFEIQNQTVVFSGGRNNAESDDSCWILVFYKAYAVVVYIVDDATAKKENDQPEASRPSP